jgi:peroxiredoxin
MFLFLILARLAFAAPQPLSVNPGEPALVFGLPSVNEAVALSLVNRGNVSLSDFTGIMPPQPRKAVVVHFFDRSHGADTLKALNVLQKRYAGKGVQMLAVCADEGNPNTLVDWVAGQKLTYPVLRDGHSVVVGRYGITELPITIVVDGEGRVFGIGQPKGEAAMSAIEAEINGLIRR